ncbi:hypothetical protein Q4485_06910 [Granulosicoccaceae sp. 1_MG-2023]|nr:hypothetical protein [Granulosicoccaceae sp. 1_MG-2023]
MSMVLDDDKWYTQRGSRLAGPYSRLTIHRYLLLGRIKNSDRVSKDGKLWEPITQVPELIPEELLDLDSDMGWKKFLRARDLVDERRQARAEEDQHQQDRVEEEVMLTRLRDEWNRSLNLQPNRPHSVLPVSLFGVTVIAGIVIILLNLSAP